MAVRKRINQSGVVWYVDLYLPDGTRYRKAVGTKKEAQIIERRIKTQIQEGTWGLKPKSDILFSELMPRYFEYTKLNRAASTHKINTALRVIWFHFLGNTGSEISLSH